MKVRIDAPTIRGQEKILSRKALEFLAGIEKKFGARRRKLMKERLKRQKELDKTGVLDFPAETAGIRAASWSIRPVSAELQDRRVEITGPVERKMIINALNSGASVFMADFEDSNTPTWSNQINGQINLKDANLGTIHYHDPATAKDYSLKGKSAVLMVRPRGLHMEEKHLKLRMKSFSASFFDFGLYLFHNYQILTDKGSAPYFYLPKMESYQEARLWNDVLVYAEDTLGLPRGTIRVTVLIETITASFQMDEILYELREHITGLNCGRWDYIFSFIKKFSKHDNHLLPDRGEVTMTSRFLRSYSLNLIRTCHQRKAHAMGGMAAQIPIKNNEEANRLALEKFVADKEREAADGHDGTWVAHPALVQKAREIFDRVMPKPNQIDKMRDDVHVAAKDLLAIPAGSITEEGVRKNINIGLLYLRAWLSGNGCVPLYNMMEDAATAEISRTQLWQWRRYKAKLKDGRVLDDALMQSFLTEEEERIAAELGTGKYLRDAIDLFQGLVMSKKLEEFLTTKAYDMILGYEKE
jgi:malate synthase